LPSNQKSFRSSILAAGIGVLLQPGVAQDESALRKSIAQWNIYLKITALRTITEQAVTAHVHGGRVHNAGRYDQLRSRELD
jgi:hypothetical protein